MTEQEILDLLAMPNKTIMRKFEWSKQEGAKGTPWMIFDSSVQIGPEIPQALRFMAKYRAETTINRGAVSVSLPEKIDVGLIYGGNRISAYDTYPGQRHTNSVGKGRPYYGQTITSTTHRHIWIGRYGYVEPVEPPLLDVVQLIKTFAKESNLILNGAIRHPLYGQQGELL